MATAKLNPTLFDKLTGGERAVAIVEEGRAELQDVNARAQRQPAVNLDRYTESAMRASVRRELSWLLNTVNLGASVDLSRTPQVKTSVLNYGLPDLTGRTASGASAKARATDMEQAIRTFEPRLDPAKLHVEMKTDEVGLDNAVAYTIHGDITAAVQAMPVQFYASVEVETGEAVVQD